MWNVKLNKEPGLRIPNMFDAAIDGTFMGLYVQGEDILQSDPNTKHVVAALSAMECVIVHDLFLNETANSAHVFFPGSTFLEKNGTFTNAERRIQRVRKVTTPRNGLEDWEVTLGFAKALGYEMRYAHPSDIMDEIAALTPTFAGVSFAKLDELGSVQWPCNEKAPLGTPVMHIDGFVCGKGKFMLIEYIATDERTGPRFPLLLTTGRILSQYNVGAQTRRTDNVVWHQEDRLEMYPHDAEQRGICDGDWCRLQSRAGETTLRALLPCRSCRRTVRRTGRRIMTSRPATRGGSRRWWKLRSRPMHDPVRSVGRQIWRKGALENVLGEGSRLIPEEAAIALTYNGGSYAVMMGSPTDLRDFAIGLSLSEGIVQSSADIASFDVIDLDDGIELRMWLAPAKAERVTARRRHIAGPTGCGICGIDSIAEAVRPAAVVAAGRSFAPQEVMTAMAGIAPLQAINIETRAVHAAAFWMPSRGIVALREDVGRHNALDKLAGALGRTTYPLAKAWCCSPAGSRSKWCRRRPRWACP
jgi:formate dehydrogenase accessory protein FdhD